MEVFQAVKDELEKKGDVDRPQHFSLESLPETEAGLADRNEYLLRFGITPIWFPTAGYDYIEQILRLARNEMRYRGHEPGAKRNYEEQEAPSVELQQPKVRKNGLVKALSFLGLKK